MMRLGIRIPEGHSGRWDRNSRKEGRGKVTVLGWKRAGKYNAAATVVWLTVLLVGAWPAWSAEPIRYALDLGAPESHLVHVNMNIPEAAAGTELQFPAWNCLYQMRDFVKDVQDLTAECDGQPASLTREDLNTWRGPDHACGELALHYAVYADAEGPFDSILDEHHAFLNLAMVLFYLAPDRGRAMRLSVRAPTDWKIATLLEGEGAEFAAADYDELVDSPVEAGHFEQFSFPLDSARLGATDRARSAAVRVIIDADPADYAVGRLRKSLEAITAAETGLMQDVPFGRYSFILHFPRGPVSAGGMEHRNGTAIALPATLVREDMSYLEGMAAHEFFHAWNVKRIRPQALEPIDYVHGNDTRDLWFCEGVTSTYAQLALLRAGLIDRTNFYARVASALSMLENRPARAFQSVEESGREAWLEKYPDYNRPERSVSYYNKGEVLGYLLDLGMRGASRNQAGLDDLMRQLNQDFARQGRFYTDADLAAEIARLAPAFDFPRFYREYVQGTETLDYATYFGYAGLRTTVQATEQPVPGFSASSDGRGMLRVNSVDPDSAAQSAGLGTGDILLKLDGKPLARSSALPLWRPGQTVELEIARGSNRRVVRFQIGVNRQVNFRLDEDSQASAAQRQVREGWLRGSTQ